MSELEQRDFRELAAAFSLGEFVASHRIWAGTVNINYRVETTQGTFFLRINQGKEEGEVRYEIDVLEYFVANQVVTPLPKVSQSGQRYYKYLEYLISVFDWQEGKHVDSKTIEDKDCEMLGAALGRLHSCESVPEAMLRESRYSDTDLRTRFGSFSRSPDRELAVAISAIEVELSYLESVQAGRGSLARGLIHADLFPDNVIVQDERLVLLDFEQACAGHYVYDLAVAVNAWCFSERFEKSRLVAMLTSYSQAAPLSVNLGELLVELRASALRFLITRITDVYLQPAVSPTDLQAKDFRRFLMRLDYWRTLDSRAIAELAQL
ncbi:MAG: homoserine kinase [Kofleriaceae bacterium]|nr:homoserine kinase [Kofleriaceae bacterium]